VVGTGELCSGGVEAPAGDLGGGRSGSDGILCKHLEIALVSRQEVHSEGSRTLIAVFSWMLRRADVGVSYSK
jgi:hypothetical protein